MRYNYPISSQELKDNIDQIYEMQLYTLSYYDGSGVQSHTGIYDVIESSGINTFASGYNGVYDLTHNINYLDYIEKYIMKNNEAV